MERLPGAAQRPGEQLRSEGGRRVSRQGAEFGTQSQHPPGKDRQTTSMEQPFGYENGPLVLRAGMLPVAYG